MTIFEEVRERFIGTSHKFTVRPVWMTIPNLVTSIGLVCVLIYALLLVQQTQLWLTPALLVVIVLTDMFDGLLADQLDQHSTVGQFLDPLRDRLLTAVLLWHLFLLSPSLAVGTLLVIAVGAELLIVALAAYTAARHEEVLTVHAVGKARAALQWLLVFLFLVAVYWFHVWPTEWVVWVVGIVTAASVLAAIFYIVRSITVVR